MKHKKAILVIGSMCVVLAAIIYFKVSGGGDATAARRNIVLINAETPKRENVPYTLRFNGDVLPNQQASIFSKVSGNLERVYVDIGAAVGRGQILALIDTTELYQQYQQVYATFTNARLLYNRNKELFEQNLLARQELDNSEAAFKVARASFENAQTRLAYAKITAPFGGIVTKRFLDPGAYVSTANATLFTLMDLDHMKVMVNVLEKDIPRVAIGKRASVTVDAYPDRVFSGSIARSSQAVDLSTRTMAMEIDIPNPTHELKPGMFSTVVLTVEEHKDALTIPTQAIARDDQGSFVYLVKRGTAKRQNITTGVEQTYTTEVLSGLTAADSVITVGLQFVRDGAAVRIQK